MIFARHLLPLSVVATRLAVAQGLGGSCPNTLSCHVPTNVDTCCTEHPGGLVVLTQFWDYLPARGPANSFTIHGLWPDYCDGSFPKRCDPSRAYPSPVDILEENNATELLGYMRKYWKGDHGDENLWQHEFSEHGTCMSTLEPQCYGTDYTPGRELVDYMQQTADLHKGRDTYSWLAGCGITPSSTKTYTLDEMTRCLERGFGAAPYLGCQGKNLKEVWYFHWVRGRALGGKYEPTPSTATSKCPRTGVKYLPKQ